MGLGATAIVVFGILEATLGVCDRFVGMLGRDPTLTTRTPMWHGLIEMMKHPLIGEGFESFWLGDRLVAVWMMVKNTLHQAHNGYLEVLSEPRPHRSGDRDPQHPVGVLQDLQAASDRACQRAF